MSTIYLFFLLFLFVLASAVNIALGYGTALLLRGEFDALGLQNRLPPLGGPCLRWLKLPSLPSRKVAAPPAQAEPAASSPPAKSAPPTEGPAPLEGASLTALKLSEMMATFCQSVYEQDLLLREFLENPGDADRARQLAEGGPKFFERHLKRFNQAAAKFDALSHAGEDWLAGKQAVRSALSSLLADASQARDEFLRSLEQNANLSEALAKCMRSNVDRALTLRGQLERGLETLLRVDPGLTRLPAELLEEKGKALLGRAWIGARLAASFGCGDVDFCAASLDLIDFRAFNHQHGYAVGALVLESVDKRLHDHLKPGEWCFRLDGDRWYLLLSTADPAAAAARVDHLRQTIGAARFEWAKKEYRVEMRGALLVAKAGDKLDRLEIALREAITAARRQNLPLIQADGAEMKPFPVADLGLAPVTITL